MFPTATQTNNNSPDVLAALAGLLNEQMKAVPSGTPSTPYLHGPGGLFGVAGLSQDVISTRVQPEGLIGSLPSLGSIETDPLFAFITGFQDETGSVKDGVCDDPETAGAIKNCIQTAQFGRYEYQTRELEVNRVGQQTNRGEFLDLRLLNDPLAVDIGGVLSQQFALQGQNKLLAGADMLMRFVEVGVSFQNKIGRQLYIGSPANNSAGGGYKEFPGLDMLIGTGKVDALTGTNCESLDSDIKDMNYSLVDDVDASNNIVNVITYLTRTLRSNASKMRFGNTTWLISMREMLFYELTAVWPCSYQTYRCIFPNSVGANGTINLNVDAQAQREMIDAMREGQYLVIDGKRWSVVFDDFIIEESSGDTNQLAAGDFASDIYIIPMTVRGGRSVTFMEHLDYGKQVMPQIGQGNYSSYYWTDGGRFLWHAKPPTNWCVQHLAKIEPRLILLTPFLAGRITNVAYSPLQHTRDAHPDDDYFVDGGVSTARAAPSHFSDWNLP